MGTSSERAKILLDKHRFSVSLNVMIDNFPSAVLLNCIFKDKVCLHKFGICTQILTKFFRNSVAQLHVHIFSFVINSCVFANSLPDAREYSSYQYAGPFKGSAI